MIETEHLLGARQDIHDLLDEGLRHMAAGGDPQEQWVETFVLERLPDGAQIGYWLLVLRAAQHRAIGVAEGWLDNPATDPVAREHLTGLLGQILGTPMGSKDESIVVGMMFRDFLTRTPKPSELVDTTRFLLSILDLTDSTDLRQMILDG